MAPRKTMLDINRASPEELTESGIPRAVADAILAQRDKVGSFSSFDEVEDIAGINSEALEQIRNTTRIVAETAGKAAEATRDKAIEFARHGAQVANQVGGAAADVGRQIGEVMADRSVDVVRRTGQIGFAWLTFWPEQMRDGWQAAVALTRCRSLPDVLEVQASFWRASVERTTRLVGFNVEQARASVG